LLGVAPSASTISRLNHTLSQQFDTRRQRPLQEHWRVLYLDGVHFSIRHGDKADSTIILTALGIDLVGNKEVLALRACAEESKEGWACEARKTCAHEEPPRSTSLSPTVMTDYWQPSRTYFRPPLVSGGRSHKQRNVARLFTFYEFPQSLHRHMQTTNAIESLAEQCAATHRSDRRLHHGDELPDDCLGYDPGHSFAHNLPVMLMSSDSF
jgi:hypothetical protein